MNIISLKNLTKRFGTLTAVDNVSFSVEEGEIFGFLGPNGAGKTTTLSMLATLLPPTSGEAWVNGHAIISEKDGVRKSIGMVFQDQSLDDELTGFENMDFHGRLYRVPKDLRFQRIKQLLELVGIADRQHDFVKTYSGGMRRRLEIARGLLHQPKVLFLDEPTLGLDPQTRNLLWQYIEKLNKEKRVTIILTTHYMEEADRLCQRIAIIDKGKIVAIDSSEHLKNSIGGGVLTVKTSVPQKLESAVKKKAWKTSMHIHDNTLTIEVLHAEKKIVELISLASKNAIFIESVSIRTPTLEDVFLHFTGKTIREGESGALESFRLMKKAWGR